jgi:hypothetical protein
VILIYKVVFGEPELCIIIGTPHPNNDEMTDRPFPCPPVCRSVTLITSGGTPAPCFPHLDVLSKSPRRRLDLFPRTRVWNHWNDLVSSIVISDMSPLCVGILDLAMCKSAHVYSQVGLFS